MEIKFIKNYKDYFYDISNLYATVGSLGLDLRACFADGMDLLQIRPSYILPPDCQVSVGTGIFLNMTSRSQTTGALILPRSGLGTKKRISLGNTVGLIDNDYQGEIIVVLRNTGKEDFAISAGDRVAQLCFLSFDKPTFNVVEEFSYTTARGSNGFGSTGKN